MLTGSWLGKAAIAAIFIAIAASWFPFWKSRTLSPASVQRRVYWTSCAVAAVLIFSAALPNWQSGLFVAGGMTAILVVIAFAYSPMIKIGGTIYAFQPVHRKPDPPPALAPRDD
ncbi:hypothetical protein ACRCUN_08875 [Mycobacterium sp. LTG2003]